MIENYKLDAQLFPKFNLKRQISSWFSQKIKLEKFHTQTLVVPSGFSIEIDSKFITDLSEKQCIENAARILRKSALNVHLQKLDMNNIDEVAIEKGEVLEIPWQITHFYKHSYKSERTDESDIFNLRVNSASNDYLYAVNNGRVKTNKHMMPRYICKKFVGE